MNILTTNRICRVLAVLALVVGLQFLPAVAGATVYNPVDIQPYDEESAEIIKSGFKRLLSLKDKVNQDTENAQKAIDTFNANPTPQNKAHADEMYGQALNTIVKSSKNMKEAILNVEPEMRKYLVHLKRRLKQLENLDGYNKLSNKAKIYDEKIKAVEFILSKFDSLKEYLETKIKAHSDIAIMFVQDRQFEMTLKDVFPEPEKLFNDIGSVFEDLNAFENTALKYMSNEKTIFNLENCKKGWERVQNAMNNFNN